MDNQNPDACESAALDRLITQREIQLVALHDGPRLIHPQSAYRCENIDPQTIACPGSVADDTAHPMMAGLAPMRLTRALHATIESALADARLYGIYRAELSSLIDGGAAVRLDDGSGPLVFRPPRGVTALIAIFRGPPPWRYRKLVWYFD